MKYIILSDSNNIEPFIEPRQLSKINGETIVGRTIRLLKENGICDITITSHDKRFDNLGAKRYESKNNNYNAIEKTGYWLNAFPIELLKEPVTFLLGDVYYSENAIKTIVESETDSTLFFCSDKTKGYDKKYIKKHDEPFGYKVVDTELFKEHIEKVKKMYDEEKTRRHPIVWELYRSINGIDVNTHSLTTNYIAINDETCDIDRVEDIDLIRIKVGDYKMIKAIAIEEFTLGNNPKAKFEDLQNIVRKNPENNETGKIHAGDTFECSKEVSEYLLGANKVERAVIEVIEIIPEKTVVPIEHQVTEEPVKAKKAIRKRTTKKKE